MTSASYPSRRMNRFETFFALNNVRFAILYVFGEPKSVSEETILARLRKSSRLGSLSLAASKNQDGAEEWFVENAGCGATVFTASAGGAELNQRFLNRTVLADSGDTSKSLQVRLFTKNGATSGIYINASHALVDGRSMLHLLCALLSSDNPGDSQPKPGGQWPLLMKDWKSLVDESHSSNLSCLDEAPTFLETSELPVLSTEELAASAGPSMGDHHGSEPTPRDFQHRMDFEALRRVQSVGKHRAASVTSIVAACFMYGAAHLYGKRDRHIGISVLVDLRPFITSTLGRHDTLNQAIGTVTLALDCARMLDITAPSDVLAIASELSSQLELRLNRGEAHRTALRLCNGDFENAAPPATMELSNLGYLADIAEGQLYVAQRFDAYEDGVSCMAYTTPTQGLVCQTSCGSGLNSRRMKEVLDFAFDCLTDLST